MTTGAPGEEQEEEEEGAAAAGKGQMRAGTITAEEAREAERGKREKVPRF